MLYWECKRRLTEVRTFRELVRRYFKDSGFDSRGKRYFSNGNRELRIRINTMQPEVVRSCYLVGHSLSCSYADPLTGFHGRINVIESLFTLDRLRIPLSAAFDYLDRAIGDYERNLSKLKRQSWNPLYWLRLAFLWLIGFPFRILGAAGFDARAIEQTLAGRVVKASVGFIIFVSALLQALNYLGVQTTTWRHLHHY